MEVLMPKGWAPPIGYSNGIAAKPGRIVFVAGQVGWDEQQKFQSADIVPQFEQALKNIVAVLAEAGAKPQHICRMTAYCCDKPAYLAARRQLGKLWMQYIGRHFPAMSMIFVSDLLDNPGKIELEATAVVPAAPVKRAARRRGVPAQRGAKRATIRRRRARS
jgi:enamine deaminase RidA (YjgF/YER057c/UK114 family)